MNILQLSQISYSIGPYPVLKQVSFGITKGGVYGLIGPNGAGKSSLLKVLTGLAPKAKGSIKLRGEEILGAHPATINRLGVSRTFQNSAILPQIPVWKNIAIASQSLKDANIWQTFFHFKRDKLLYQEDKKKSLDLLQSVGLEKKAYQLGADLSYGQQKLVELLRLSMSDPDIICLDEPFSGLFPEIIRQIEHLIKHWVNQGKTLILIEHNLDIIEKLCDEVIVLDAGKVIGRGQIKELKKDPLIRKAYLGH